MGQDKIMPHKRRELIDKFVCLFVFFLCECNKNSKLLTSVSFIYIYKEFMPVKKKIRKLRKRILQRKSRGGGGGEDLG